MDKEVASLRAVEGRGMAGSQKGPGLRLLAEVPNVDYRRLIVRYPYQTDAHYAAAFQFSAQRLAYTFSGEPLDDLLLLPYLTLYRQAFELQLKWSIRKLVGLRANYFEGWADELREAVSEDRFKKELRHNLYKLLNEVKVQYAALGLPECFPRSVEKCIIMLHEADRPGTAFRYAGLLPNTQDDADFPDLAKLLDTEFDALCSVLDYAAGCCDPMPKFGDGDTDDAPDVS